jgi:hypothetical protein
MYRSTRAPRGFTARGATSSRECINLRHRAYTQDAPSPYANSFFHFSSIFFFSSALRAFTGGKRSRQA